LGETYQKPVCGTRGIKALQVIDGFGGERKKYVKMNLNIINSSWQTKETV